MKKPATVPTDTEAPKESLPLARKPGANHSDTTDRPKKRDNNFKQSNDLREDRAVRQMKSGHAH